jgi:hypothetical protein
MRAYIVLLALVATPLAIGVSQLPGKSSCNNGQGTSNRSAQGTAHAHQGLCAAQDPPPPPPPPPPLPPPPPPPPPVPQSVGCVNSGASGGTASIDGQVYVDASPWPGLQGWCLQLSGPVSATAVTDAAGNYVFTNLPAGTYTLCEVLQTGWRETFPTTGPSCSGGFGWTITVADGSGNSFIWFGNVTP